MGEPIINRVDLAEEQRRIDAAYRERSAEQCDADHIAGRIDSLTVKLDQALTRAEAAEAELREMRKDRDAALLHLPAGCGSLADAAATLKQDRDNLEAANRQLRERMERAAAETRNLRMLLSPIHANTKHANDRGEAYPVGYSDIDPLRTTSLIILGVLEGYA